MNVSVCYALCDFASAAVYNVTCSQNTVCAWLCLLQDEKKVAYLWKVQSVFEGKGGIYLGVSGTWSKPSGCRGSGLSLSPTGQVTWLGGE